MKTSTANDAARIRAKLGHPVVDADGHYVELAPVLQRYFLDFVRQVGGADAEKRFARTDGLIYTERVVSWNEMSVEKRRHAWATRPAWWGLPTVNSLDRASGFLPRLLAERLDDLGIDFAVLYPSSGIVIPEIKDAELRQIGCRAFNTFHAELYREYTDRLTPAAIVPMHTPREAIEELEHCVDELGLKAVMISGHVTRPIPWVHQAHPELDGVVERIDTLALDSDFDYDPVWAKCQELGVSPASHATEQGWGSRRSISNYVYNHMGAFSAGGETLCKALFMGGVTDRFPRLNFAFLEGGVAWACALYADLIGHWEKRNIDAIQRLNPTRVDLAALERLIDEFGYARLADSKGEVLQALARGEPVPEEIDEWARVPIRQAEQIRDLFAPRFFFGCEADDPLATWAFNTKVNPFGAKLGAMFSSDIGHWDVPDMATVLPEAYELVEDGLLGAEDFRDFVFANPVRFYAGNNPKFFEGTRCADAATRVLQS
jgi:predicted TIM-barrel fold metal-dependent hydrolase